MLELIFAIAVAILFIGLLYLQSFRLRRKWKRIEKRRRLEYERRREGEFSVDKPSSGQLIV